VNDSTWEPMKNMDSSQIWEPYLEDVLWEESELIYIICWDKCLGQSVPEKLSVS
jgi:hypothetical protein